MINELENNIRAAVNLGKKTATGFETLKCPLCNDHKVRAGFKFEPNSIGYNCFRGRCGVSLKYEEGGHLSKTFLTLLDAIGADIPSEAFLNRGAKKILDTNLYEEHRWRTIAWDPTFVPLDRERFPQHWDYVVARKIHEYPYFVAVGGEYSGRIIIPFFNHGRLVGWQAALIHRDTGTRKYLSASGNTDLLFLPEGRVPKEPIVVEGCFDALSVPGGVATLSAKMTKKQAFFLRNSNPIVVPDKKDSRLFDTALRYKWRISLPEWKFNDVNQALQAYGKFVVCRMIREGICDDAFEAKLKYRVWKYSM